jgi:hypothetical protein
VSASLDPQVWLAALKRREQEIKDQMFDAPPSTWEGFQNRLGAYQENVLVQAKLLELHKGLEESL